MTNRAWIIGATSSLAETLAHQLAQQGWQLLLSARNRTQLEAICTDIRIRHHTEAHVLPLDLLQMDTAAITSQAGLVDAVFMLAGDMGSEDKNDTYNIAHTIATNFTAPAQLLTAVAAQMETRGAGTIVIVSSVAGDRGRQSNYPYGSAKAGLTAFAAGLRNRLCKKGVHVMTVKPGFIDTPMTWGMHSPLIAPREKVASDILKAAKRKKDILYTPWFWRFIMMIICHIPERIFKRLGL